MFLRDASLHLSENRTIHRQHNCGDLMRRPRRPPALAYDRRAKLQSFIPTTYGRKSLNSEILTCSKRFLVAFSQTLYFSFKCFWELIPGKQRNKIGGCLQQIFTQNHLIRCEIDAKVVSVIMHYLLAYFSIHDSTKKTFWTANFNFTSHSSLVNLSLSVLTLPILLGVQEKEIVTSK